MDFQVSNQDTMRDHHEQNVLPQSNSLPKYKNLDTNFETRRLTIKDRVRYILSKMALYLSTMIVFMSFVLGESEFWAWHFC
jgi:hypothetical protein